MVLFIKRETPTDMAGFPPIEVSRSTNIKHHHVV